MLKGIDCKGKEWEERQLQGRAVDLRKQEFTYLTPILPVKINHKHTGFLCKCRCGHEIAVETYNLTNQNTTSCGCRHKEIVKEHWEQSRLERVGLHFNSLLIKRYIGQFKPNQTIYEFECLKCGKTFQRTWESVFKNDTKDCGCALLAKKVQTRDSIIGDTVGKLTIKKYVGMDERCDYLYECECECGNTKIVSRSNLIKKSVQSCGCLISVGENTITDILKENHISFIKQVSFPDLKSPLNGIPKYDFGILDGNNNIIRLIEFDGEQHQKAYNYFGGEEKFKKIQTNDSLKNQYALSHNIPLVRIPYSKRKHITLEMLLLNSTYLITNF